MDERIDDKNENLLNYIFISFPMMRKMHEA
jgi:hypothetical protein